MHAWLYIQFSTIIAFMLSRPSKLPPLSHSLTSLSLSLHIYTHTPVYRHDECNSELITTHINSSNSATSINFPSHQGQNHTKMSPSAGRRVLLIAAAVLLSSATTASAVKISILLGRFPGFEQFNQLLSSTHLAEEVDRHSGGITVLGLPNGRLGTLMQLPEEVQRSILSLHIILDYYDMAKLTKLPPGNKTTLTTLYQSSGVATGQQGFIDVVRRHDGTIVFGSAVPGSPQLTNFINPVVAQPFNISILSVSQPIIVAEIDGSTVQPAPDTPPPAPAAKLTPPPAASPPEEELAPDVPAPDAPPSAPAPAPASAPAPSPDADADALGADEGEGDADAADLTPEVEKSGSVKGGVGLGLGIGLAAAAFLAGN
ncbi:fasciclin-like arabinogalactan protein 3 [Salvia miltiorrhiza]|uniref:fasciclin-like arabinogalactan protein 3 n=1 Tax=Salvia miltiorrhiza TaxID=226208 RepID=UPI0025ACD2F2|nr:fasciclin-like arabinogalactan protein 3 [Salvia miltiorrhiza]